MRIVTERIMERLIDFGRQRAGLEESRQRDKSEGLEERTVHVAERNAGERDDRARLGTLEPSTGSLSSVSNR